MQDEIVCLVRFHPSAGPHPLASSLHAAGIPLWRTWVEKWILDLG